MKKDYPLNQAVAESEINDINVIVNALAVENEDYKVGDILVSAITSNGDITGYPQENKSIRHKQLMSGDTFNRYFSTDYPYGVMKKIQFLEGYMPESWKGKYIYMLNAEDKYGNQDNGKFQKLIRDKAILCYVAVDGYLLFSPKKIKEAFLGFARYNCRHTTDLNDNDKSYELKAFIDLSKGTFFKHNFNKELFEYEKEKR